MSGTPAAAPSEFRAGWRVLVAAALGTAFGASPIPFNSAGPFTAPLAAEFGWGRGQIQLALFWFTLAVVVTVPLVGALADRIGVRKVALATTLGFALCYAALALTPASLLAFYALWVLMGVVGGGSTPVSWTRAVNVWFERSRGLALAVTLLGTGLTGALLPSLATWLIDHHGWRLAFAAIALLPLLIALPVAWAWFREPPVPAAAATLALPPVGVTLAVALRDRRFWVLAGSIGMVAIAIGGSITNFQPLLGDKGYTRADAARIAGAIGLSVVMGRLLAGWLIDRYWAPAVTAPMLALPALACLILVQETISPGAATLAALLIGFAAGAESDLIAFLTARYFGLAHYGRIYGLQYAVFGLGSGFSPFLFGRVYDRTGSYTPILAVACGLFIAGACLLLAMGHYPRLTSPPQVA